uniref:Cation channel sperm associated 4 n=1 Tax=Chelydra serpentina TaxID=8475 RepID=A0A8C3SJV2_CHESE
MEIPSSTHPFAPHRQHNRKEESPELGLEFLPADAGLAHGDAALCFPPQDNWDVEEFVSKVCMGRFLNHPAFKITLAALIIGNALIIASRTEVKVEEKYYGLFSAIDNIVLTVLTCEVLLNWYYGFRMYWKDGWNVVNFFIVAYLCVGPFVPGLNDQKIFRVLRVMRLMQVCTLVEGLARMIRVILQSIPDMVNIMVLLFAIMLIFSVFGVTLFGNLVPLHFGNLGAALYSLFICLTQDGWMNIYEIFVEEGTALKIGGGLYFFIFITGGAFICTNLLVAVVTSNLEQTMVAYGMDHLMISCSDDSSPELNLVHLKTVMEDTPMTHRQMPLIYGNLGNLTEASCDDFCLILEGIQENLKRYKEIRDELNTTGTTSPSCPLPSFLSLTLGIASRAFSFHGPSSGAHSMLIPVRFGHFSAKPVLRPPSSCPTGIPVTPNLGRRQTCKVEAVGPTAVS